MLELYEQNGVVVSINDCDFDYKYVSNNINYDNEVEALLSKNGVNVMVGTGKTYIIG